MLKKRNRGIEIADIGIQQVEEALERPAKEQSLPAIAVGLKKYIWLIDRFQKAKNISQDECFRKAYDDFFKIKQRRLHEKFYDAYYALMQKCKQDGRMDITFPEILKHLDKKVVLYEKKWSVEASLCSKLLSMINKNMPVWDKWIRQNLQMSPISAVPAEKRMEKANSTFQSLCEKYEFFFEKDKAIAEEWIERFDDAPEIKPIIKEANAKKVKITDVKKIDLILWQIR